MLTTVLDTADLPPAERAAVWVETKGRALISTHVSFRGPDPIQARIQTMALGPSQLSVVSYTSMSSQRTPKLIRQSDREMYQLSLTLAGQHSIEQARTYAALGPGDLLLYDSSRPFTASAGPPSEVSRTLLLQLPRHLLPLPEKVVAPLCGAALDGRSGVGRLLSQLLTALTDTHADLTSRDSIRLGATAVDLATVLLAHHADRQTLLPTGSRQRALFEQISAHIATHLGDPHLTPRAIAAAHFISTRYLHRIFQQHGTAVSDVIRQQRLARCRRDLADPAQRAVPIAAIAMRWGYPRPSDFTRSFRAATGMTPSEYRAASQDTDRAQR
ncbi:helix-turn-helix domain-containing protein [Streptomyces sp. NPDC050287]|uniref:AraC-like ligand-binding domain-containing protein n=1 Tax=Streptomyces sp. NPDC050287 TaxID=3365608 RepID=UPI0037AF6DA6